MTKNTYQDFNSKILNVDFFIKSLSQNLSHHILNNIENINLDNMEHRFPKNKLSKIKMEFTARCKAEKDSLVSLLSKYFSWSKEAITICEIILHAVAENQFTELDDIASDFEGLMILRLHGLQISRNISLIKVESGFDFVEKLIENERNIFYSIDRKIAKKAFNKKMEFDQIILYKQKYAGTYYFADYIEMNYWRLIREE